MNPLLTTKAETFRSGTDNLEFYHNRLIKLTNGVLLFVQAVHHLIEGSRNNPQFIPCFYGCHLNMEIPLANQLGRVRQIG